MKLKVKRQYSTEGDTEYRDCSKRDHTATLTLQFEQVRSLCVNVRSLGLEHLVETLALQAASGHCEVHKRHPRAEVRRELHLEKEEGRGEGGGRRHEKHAQ